MADGWQLFILWACIFKLERQAEKCCFACFAQLGRKGLTKVNAAVFDLWGQAGGKLIARIESAMWNSVDDDDDDDFNNDDDH